MGKSGVQFFAKVSQEDTKFCYQFFTVFDVFCDSLATAISANLFEK